MYKLWRLRRVRRKIQRRYERDRAALVRAKAPHDDVNSLYAQESSEVQDVEMDIDLLMSLSLLDDARSLDVDIPNYEDAKMWFHDEIRGRVWLSTHGRSVVRKLIDEEKARRFEVRTRWITKVILPLAAAAIGIIGATTGLLAILHQKK